MSPSNPWTRKNCLVLALACGPSEDVRSSRSTRGLFGTGRIVANLDEAHPPADKGRRIANAKT